MRKIVSLILLMVFLGSCKSKPINQKVDKKPDGLWITTYNEDGDNYKSIENYKNGVPIKKWKNYKNGQLLKKERYNKEYSTMKFYQENGKVESKGKTILEIDQKYAHWFYQGDWKFYDENGKLIKIKKYNKGKLISEEFIKNKKTTCN